MTLQQLTYFLEVARTLHFTLAAQNLYVSQASLSHSIQMLEQELEVNLFIRSNGKKVHLTNYGQAFLPYCEKIMIQLQDGQKLLKQMRNPMSGVVKISYSYVNSFSLVPNIFNCFYKENNYSDISVKFNVIHDYVTFEQDVLSGKSDLGFACTKNYKGLETIPIADQELVLMLPANHPLAHEKKLSLHDIKNEQFFIHSTGSNLYNWIKKMFQLYDLKPNITTDHSDWSCLMSCVALGLGMTIAPRLPVDPNLISVVEIDHPLNHRNVYLMWAENKKLTPAVEYVRQYCINYSKEHFGELNDE